MGEGQADRETRASVLVIEDDAIVRAWVRTALAGSDFRLAGEATSADAGAELALRRSPDLLLVDYRLPDEFGTELIRRLRRSGFTAPAIVVTANPEVGLNEVAREAGAQGSVLKAADPAMLICAMRSVLAGEPAFEAAHPRRPVGQAALTPREKDVLRLAAAGSTNREIATMLGIGHETVKTLLERVYAKLGAANRTEAVSEALRQGLL